MTDIQSPRWLYAKGTMMLVVGLLAFVLLFLEHPTWKTALFGAVSIWGFCRAYYFAFYVIEHYIDGNQRYAGLIDFVKRHWRRRA